MDKVKQIVESFDLQNSKLQSEKECIINSWKDSFNDEEFTILLKILENYSYYSESAIGYSYKSLVEKSFSSQEMADTENLYLPLKTKDVRAESSEVLFYQFYKYNNIDTNYIKYTDSSDELERVYEAWIEYGEIVDSDGNLIKNNEFNRKKDLERNYIGIKRIFLIDDFVGTGTSVSKFIKKNHNNIKKLNFLKINFIFIAGTNFGFNSIKKVIKDYQLDNIHLYFFEDMIEFFDLENNKEILSTNEINILKEKFNELYDTHEIKIGNFNRNTAISSFYNSPNCNIPLFINSTESWDALFERKNRIKHRKIESSTVKDNLRRISND